MYKIVEATEVGQDLVEALGRLVPQLSSSAPLPGPADLAEIVASPATRLFLARQVEPTGGEHAPVVQGVLLGTLTLVVFRIPSGVRAWIEDVIVDDGARGQGIGAALTEAALDAAAEAGARTVELTSRPSRRSANRLYQRLGFVSRETNVYRRDLEGVSR